MVVVVRVLLRLLLRLLVLLLLPLLLGGRATAITELGLRAAAAVAVLLAVVAPTPLLLLLLQELVVLLLRHRPGGGKGRLRGGRGRLSRRGFISCTRPAWSETCPRSLASSRMGATWKRRAFAGESLACLC